MTDAAPVFDHGFPQATDALWRERVNAVLKGADFDSKLVSRTRDGLGIQPLAPPRHDAARIEGAQAGKPWSVIAKVDHPQRENAAAQAREDLEGGATGLALTFADGAGARGYGMAPESVDDLAECLEGVRLDLVDLKIDPAPGGRIQALMLAALIERQKLDPAQMRIDFGLDPIGSVLAMGQVPWDWIAMAPRLGETASSLRAKGFAGPLLTVDIRRWHEAGATEAQELAAALATGVLYLRALEAHGLSLAEAFAAVSFTVAVDADQFMGIAKLRALRRLWQRIALWSDQVPRPVQIHAETSWRMLAKQDAHVNILRSTIATFAAGVGGADSISVLPFTAVHGLPDSAARRLARNTGVVLIDEVNLWRVADPSTGAGSIEALTDGLEQKAWELFREIEGEGGLLVSLVLGKLQARVADAAATLRQSIARRKDLLTGVSAYPDLAEIAVSVHEVEPARFKKPRIRAGQKAVLSSDAVVAAFVKGQARNTLLPAAEGVMTVTRLESHRNAEPFEELRAKSDALTAKAGERPQVTLLLLGDRATFAPRMSFIEGFFEVAGMAVIHRGASDKLTPAERLVCLVGTDDDYATQAVERAKALARKGRAIWLAGRPAALEALLAAAGIARFVTLGGDAIEALSVALKTVSGGRKAP